MHVKHDRMLTGVTRRLTKLSKPHCRHKNSTEGIQTWQQQRLKFKEK